MKTIVKSSVVLLLTAAFAVSCEQIPKRGQEGTYILNVEASQMESPATKALEISGSEGHHVLSASWETTDVISVTKSGRVLGSLSPKTSGPSATLAGEITGDLRVGNTLYLSMPGDGTESDYTGQDGKLETIASRYDYIHGRTSVSSIKNGTVTCSPVKFSSDQAIVKLILIDREGNPVCPDRLVLSAQDRSGNSMLYTTDDKLGQLAVDLDVSDGGTNEIFVAIKQYSDASVFQVDAYIPGFVYRMQKTTTTYFEAGKYYEITVNLGTPEEDPSYTLKNFLFHFDFGTSMQAWPVFVFFDGITTGYWFDPDGSGSGTGAFVDLGGTVVADLAFVKTVTAVSMPRLTDQRPVYEGGKWTFDQIEGWRYIGASKVGCAFSRVGGNPGLSADITLTAPETTGREIRVYNDANCVRVAYNNLIPMGLASISSDGLINEVNPDPGGWISMVGIGTTSATYGYARTVDSPTSFAYLALERKSGGTSSYYHMFRANAATVLIDYTDDVIGDYSVIQDHWRQVGAGHYATVGGMTWWTTNLAEDRVMPEPHPWKATPLSWTLDTEGNSQFNADRNTRSLSEIKFFDDSELPTINYDYMVFFDNTKNYQFKLRACGVNGVIFADNEDPSNFIFLAVPDRENYEFVYYYTEGSYIVYRANDYYWAKEYNSEQDHQHFSYDGSHGEDYWNFYCTSAFSINIGSYPTYRFPFTGTGMDGYGLPDFGCSAGPIEGRLQPVRVYLPARPVKK